MKKSPTLLQYLPLSLIGCLVGCTTASPNKSPTLQKKPAQPKIALVLGGGGTRGFAHIGVLEVLEAHHIKPDIIIGTSSGAMVGAVYASGKSANQLHRIASALQEDELLDISPSKQGLISGEKLANFINEQVEYQPIEKLPITFRAVATEMHTNTAVAFGVGDTGQAVRASASVPKLFIPPRLPYIDGSSKKYVDGGRSALVPARFAKQLGADIIISVDLLANTAQSKPVINTKPTASITKTQTGISAKWGEQTLELPLDFAKLTSQKLPFGIRLDDGLNLLLEQIPTHQEIALPTPLVDIINNPADVWQLLNQATTGAVMADEDKAFSDVIIRPNLTNFSVFSSKDKEGMILAGKQATQMQLANIQTLITHHQPASHTAD